MRSEIAIKPTQKGMLTKDKTVIIPRNFSRTISGLSLCNAKTGSVISWKMGRIFLVKKLEF